MDLGIVNDELRVLSTTDPLTGVANRRCFDLSLERSWVTSAMLGQPVSLLMLDIDHFKKSNDSLGHAEGDECLHEAAQTIALNVRNGIDLVARYGGEEFVVILPDASAELAFTKGEGIRKSVEALKLSSTWPLTVSIGVATAIWSWSANP